MRMLKYLVIALLAVYHAPSSALANTGATMTTSWYGPGMECYETPQGCVELMANGGRFNMYDPTVVAHKSLPFGTELRLTNPENGRTIVVEVQDRGPFVEDRELDVSLGAAQRLGIVESGVVELEVEILD